MQRKSCLSAHSHSSCLSTGMRAMCPAATWWKNHPRICKCMSKLCLCFSCTSESPGFEATSLKCPHPTSHSTLGMLHSEAFQQELSWPRNADSESFDVFRWYNKNISRSKAETLLRDEVNQRYAWGGWETIIN